MRVDRIVLGLTVAIVGIVWLLVNLGLISGEVVRELWLYWPILLVVWGLLLFLGKGGDSAVFLMVVLVIMFIGFVLFAYMSPYHRNQPGWRQGTGLAVEENSSAVELIVPQYAVGISGGELFVRSETVNCTKTCNMQSL